MDAHFVYIVYGQPSRNICVYVCMRENSPFYHSDRSAREVVSILGYVCELNFPIIDEITLELKK